MIGLHEIFAIRNNKNTSWYNIVSYVSYDLNLNLDQM